MTIKSHSKRATVTAAALAMLAMPGLAMAQDIDASAGPRAGCLNANFGFSPEQSFVVPVGESSIAAFNLAIDTNGQASTLRFSIFEYQPGTDTVGAEIVGENRTVNTASPNATVGNSILTTPVAVTPGATYLIRATKQAGADTCAATQGNAYAGGGFSQRRSDGLLITQSANDLIFTVDFAAAPPPPPAVVPTLTEWALILFGTVLAGGAALMVQRRRFKTEL